MNNLKNCRVSRTFILKPHFTVDRICQELEACDHAVEIKAQDSSSTASGTITLGGYRWVLNLTNDYVERGDTTAEIETTQERDGRTDRYTVLLSWPERVHDAPEAQREVEVQGLQREALHFLEGFLRQLGARPPAFTASMWQDLPDIPADS